MCSEGQPITYETLIPPEAREFRRQLYDYIGGPQSGNLFSQGVSPFPGQLPFTQAPNPGQMAGINTILALLGYPGMQMGGLDPNTLGSLYTGADNTATTQPTGGPQPHPGYSKPAKDPYAPGRKEKKASSQ